MVNQITSQKTSRFWTPAELADYLRVSIRWVYEHTRTNCCDPIPHIKLGKYIRFNPESPAFIAWLQRQSVAQES